MTSDSDRHGADDTGWVQSGTINTGGWTASTGVVKVGDTDPDCWRVSGQPAESPAVRQDPQAVRGPSAGRFRRPAEWRGCSGSDLGAATLTFGTFNPATGVYTSTAGGLLTLTIGDGIIYGGQFQNVTAAPAASAVITSMVVRRTRTWFRRRASCSTSTLMRSRLPTSRCPRALRWRSCV